MLPMYGKIAIILFILILIPTTIIAIYYGNKSKDKGKMIAVLAIGIVPLMLLFGMVDRAGSDMNTTEIKEKIQSLGGTVISIQKTQPQNTPFQSAKRKTFGDHFKVTYTINGTEQVAWYSRFALGL